ncbi:MAG: ABC transporter substrate-binding protein, partial [Ilumatobacteraceae bacterium]
TAVPQPETTAVPTTDATLSTDTIAAELIPAEWEVTADAPIPADRCAANIEAGPILYLSSFDFAATASIVEVLVAESKGYFDELCLDVQLTPSFSVENYPLIAANDAQFSSGGSFSEMADFADTNDAGYVALAVDGRTGIDALITKDGLVPDLADVRGQTIGVKGAITPSVKAMLAALGLVAEEDYSTVLLDGFDPKVHIESPGIVGFPGYKSNEPLQLEAAGIPFRLYDPSDYDIPGSFGVIYTNITFLTEFPAAAQDFMRAAMRGLADALADPAAAAAIAVEAINANGNAMYLSPEGETARWQAEARMILEDMNSDAPYGLPIKELLLDEVTTYASIGLFDGIAPEIDSMIDESVLAGIYTADGTVIWPAPSAG